MKVKKEKIVVFVNTTTMESGDSISKYIRDLFKKDGRYDIVYIKFTIIEVEYFDYNFEWMLLSDFIDKRKS